MRRGKGKKKRKDRRQMQLKEKINSIFTEENRTEKKKGILSQNINNLKPNFFIYLRSGSGGKEEGRRRGINGRTEKREGKEEESRVGKSE